ncbi:hypothetical protein ACFO0J_10135 [Castellaniella hirudinis]|uniref:Uncharacterized protein n=1 Tax=Castellaniella hirudinis TaxID=1144617 RepID=A0ABV8RZS4_9BURK
MEFWARRQRDTNQLARIIGQYVLNKRSPTSNHLYALSKLSWITNSYSGTDAGYITSTKIPALGELLGCDYGPNATLGSIAEHASKELGSNQVRRLILGHTGFTNFYKAYRNSVREWIHLHHGKLLPLYRAALKAKNARDRLDLISAIEKLPGIPKANHPTQTMRPEYFLTPVFFMLDPQVKFPIINGNEGVRKLLEKLDVGSSDLTIKYKAMVGLYGQGGVKDAADLDQLGRHLPDFFDSPRGKATKQLLRSRSDNQRDLTLKDEADYLAAKEATTIVHRKIHNQLTNTLHETLGQRLSIFEGINDCMFDAMVSGYNGDDNLLIEVKSSIELPHLRMAIGQLLNYWFQLYPEKDHHLAVLVPQQPSASAIQFLDWMKIGTLWFEEKKLKTCTHWLDCIAEMD